MRGRLMVPDITSWLLWRALINEMKLHIIHFKGHFTLSEIFPLVIWQGFCFSFFKKLLNKSNRNVLEYCLCVLYPHLSCVFHSFASGWFSTHLLTCHSCQFTLGSSFFYSCATFIRPYASSLPVSIMSHVNTQLLQQLQQIIIKLYQRSNLV